MDMNMNIPKFLDEALTPVAKETGERLADIINLIFTPIIKKKAVRDKNLEIFLKELEKEVNKIPEDKLQNPELHIIAPILEDVGKYYHDEEYLRRMFSKLIASSLNKESYVHPSYGEIIKQLSLFDLSILKKVVKPFKDENTGMFYYYRIESNKYYYTLWNDSCRTNWFDAGFIFKCNHEDYVINDINNKEEFVNSLINLQRLGLIKIIDNGVDNSKKISDFNIISIGYDGTKEKKIGSFKIVATPYLVKFMDVCCSEKMYNSIK